MEVRKGLILTLGLLIASCNVINSTDNNIELQNNYQNDKSFSVKLLSSSYIKTKLENLINLSTIPAQNNEAQKGIVREINFYSLEDQKNSNSYYKNLYDDIINTTPAIHSSIIAMSQVIAKRSQNIIINSFLNSSPIGEFRVNTYTNGSQESLSTAMDSNGNFVVTWQSSQSQDGSDDGIYGQRYNLSGIKQGSEFRVNTYTNRHQSYPSVAMDNVGNFVVTWHSYGQDGSEFGVYGQRYNSVGTPQGSEFRVNTFTARSQALPSVAMSFNGNFVVTWNSYGQDGSGTGVYGQRYNSIGIAQGSEFRVNTFTAGDQYASSTAMDSSGNFVVTWQSPNQDGSLDGIYGQRYNSSGTAQGTEFKVNTYTLSRQNNPSIAMDNMGNFVVTWQSLSQDGSVYGIYGQRYNSSGIKQGLEFKINTYTTDTQNYPSVAMDNVGNFVVTWGSLSQDGSSEGIYGQRYNSSGIEQGSEFRVNTYTNSYQSSPSSSMSSTGNFIITWTGNNQDGSGSGAYGQRYDSNGNPR